MSSASLGLVRAPWFGHAVAIAAAFIVVRWCWAWLVHLEQQFLARRLKPAPLPSHVHQRLADDARETARRWR